MDRRIANIILFLGGLFGAVLVVNGLVEIGNGNRVGWTSMLGGVLAIVLAIGLVFTLRRRRRDKVITPE